MRKESRRKTAFFFVYLIGESGKNTVQRTPTEAGCAARCRMSGLQARLQPTSEVPTSIIPSELRHRPLAVPVSYSKLRMTVGRAASWFALAGDDVAWELYKLVDVGDREVVG